MSTPITFKEFKSQLEFHQQEIENISQKSFTVHWVDDYYDGMLSGVLEYHNQKFRFEIITDYKNGIYPRVFGILQLSEKEIEEEFYWHALFRKYVSTQNDLNSEREGILQPQSEWHLFYDKYQKRPNKGYELNIVKGWFIEES